jgi:hypothetical protein
MATIMTNQNPKRHIPSIVSMAFIPSDSQLVSIHKWLFFINPIVASGEEFNSKMGDYPSSQLSESFVKL